jgi:hypothetical protein
VHISHFSEYRVYQDQQPDWLLRSIMRVMFCPVCKVEHRFGFSRCADCDVNLVEELPTESSEKNTDISVADKGPTQGSFERFRTKSLTKSVLNFGLHQFIGMYGVPFTAPIVFSLGFKLLFLFGHNYPRKTFYSIVSELPYFPIQIVFAVILGWLLGRVLRDRSMVWIWLLPLAELCYSVATRLLNPTSVFIGVGQSWFSHYFGWGCRPADHCLDQLVITLPFYSSLAYSFGAVLARKTLGFASSQSGAHFHALWVVGVIVLGAVVIDLAISTIGSGWQTGYLLVALTPTGLGALLLYAGSTLHRQPVSNA